MVQRGAECTRDTEPRATYPRYIITFSLIHKPKPLTFPHTNPLHYKPCSRPPPPTKQPNNQKNINLTMSSTPPYPIQSQEYSSQSLYDTESSPLDLRTYAKKMHQHTKKQMEAMSKSARRSSPNGMSDRKSLETKESASSVDSRAS